MAHGYAKIEGKPMLVLAHGTVGLQHASMAIYNAWCDRVPVYMMVGNTLDAPSAAAPRSGPIRCRTPPRMVRDFVKWDDTPGLARAFRRDSAVRAYKIAMTPPMAPVLLMVLDSEMQDQPLPERSEKLGHPQAVAHGAGRPATRTRWPNAPQMLVNAENPVIVADRNTRSQAGIDHLVELAETLHAP